MVENRPVLNIVQHGLLILGAALFVFPIYVAFIASTHTARVSGSALVLSVVAC